MSFLNFSQWECLQGLLKSLLLIAAFKSPERAEVFADGVGFKILFCRLENSNGSGLHEDGLLMIRFGNWPFNNEKKN